MSSDAVAAAYARYEADPTLANFEEAIHEGLKEVDWVVQSVGASFAETSTLTDNFPIDPQDIEAAHQLHLPQYKEIDENLEVLLAGAKFLLEGGEPLQVQAPENN